MDVLAVFLLGLICHGTKPTIAHKAQYAGHVLLLSLTPNNWCVNTICMIVIVQILAGYEPTLMYNSLDK